MAHNKLNRQLADTPTKPKRPDDREESSSFRRRRGSGVLGGDVGTVWGFKRGKCHTESMGEGKQKENGRKWKKRFRN